MFTAKNTKKQGDIGLGAAIAYFVSSGFTVSIPLTDSQPYDLVVDIDGRLCRVQVKTTKYRGRSGKAYYISLPVKGGNRTGTGKIKAFDKSAVDYVFIFTEDGSQYLIPSSVCGNTVRLWHKYDKFRLGSIKTVMPE